MGTQFPLRAKHHRYQIQVAQRQYEMERQKTDAVVEVCGLMQLHFVVE
jgi:hypothetical protein